MNLTITLPIEQLWRAETCKIIIQKNKSCVRKFNSVHADKHLDSISSSTCVDLFLCYFLMTHLERGGQVRPLCYPTGPGHYCLQLNPCAIVMEAEGLHANIRTCEYKYTRTPKQLHAQLFHDSSSLFCRGKVDKTDRNTHTQAPYTQTHEYTRTRAGTYTQAMGAEGQAVLDILSRA